MTSQPLWAPLGDALKLILTGSTDQPFSPSQRTIFLNMIARAAKDENGKPLETPVLPGVETQQYCVDEENQRYEQYWYIPSLVRYMIGAFDEWSILNPPLALDYLNSLVDTNNRNYFLYEAAPGSKMWAEFEEGQEYWSLICKELDLKSELAELERTHHGNDPLRFEAQRRMRKELGDKLNQVKRKISTFDTNHDTNNNSTPPDITHETKAISAPSSQPDWIPIARELGIGHVQAFPHLSIEQIAKKVHLDLIDKKIVGRGDRVPLPETIKRHALSGIKNS